MSTVDLTGKTITLTWPESPHITITGTVLRQSPNGRQTTIIDENGVNHILYGQCQVGNCGSFTVLSIK